MLRKLFKYEFKATGRVFLPLFASLLAFAFISRILSVFDFQQTFPVFISHTIYIIIMAGMFVMTLTVMIQRFNKNLLSDEGYLMFTLPTNPWQHIVSKLLVSMLWITASVIAAVFTILIITYKAGAISETIRGLSLLISRLSEYWSVSASFTIFEVIIAIFSTLTSGILLIYASIAVGHLFSKHKILASFGAFIILNTLAHVLVNLISLVIKVVPLANIHISSYNFANNLPAIQMALAFGIIIAGLKSAAYFAITNFILSKRLNLE
ncbi:ABC transporter ATP-binding protein [Desulfocucumis palustris]|uniref:ABC transporter ATP-binding protein n=1 Tax=Desulfocucumis palustris TaxID=1898651 RepID=A0A2L2XD07_9FIRM|nr:hypothetical protein [Desulfocucumis palustris]GBF34229.1 ABC transporter ATP-binding protein [Desulfocucumis palustris]